MATTTPNYGLNQWESDDIFIRTDFNEDNVKVDMALGLKVDDSVFQEALSQKVDFTSLNTALAQKCEVVLGTYTGNGNDTPDTQNITLGFYPSAVLVCEETNFYYGAVLTTRSTRYPNALCLNDDGFTVCGGGGGFINNYPGRRYTYIAFH